MEAVAEQIKPGATVKEAIAALDADPAYQLHGTDELKAWMQTKADEAIAKLAGTHFDIPDPVRTIECLIARPRPVASTTPAPARTSRARAHVVVRAEGRHRVRHPRELTTVYHEGVPGHHLQVAQTVFRSELLNRWRRMFAWTSGTARAGRSTPSGSWPTWATWTTRATGWACSTASRCAPPASCSTSASTAGSRRRRRSAGRVDLRQGLAVPHRPRQHGRGLPALRARPLPRLAGPAPAYKIGERLWMELRDEAKRREGEAFDIKTFHRRALDIGGVGLDTLREAVLGDSE